MEVTVASEQPQVEVFLDSVMFYSSFRSGSELHSHPVYLPPETVHKKFLNASPHWQDMRLLNSKSHQLERFHFPPDYAIVSHRWGSESEEVLFLNIGDEAQTRSKGRGYAKIEGACTQAMQDELSYVWLDTCCIDKKNSGEVYEAINSMYKWYRESDVCYAYLHDVSDLSEFTKSDWLSRGWTLQELIAPKKLKFFTKDWRFLGTREDLIGPISEVTGICRSVLQSAKIPRAVTISQKMCWAAKRKTTMVEDMAYSLLGLFGVNMVPIYGIDGAFVDLQHHIIANGSDQTLFSWYHTYTQPKGIEAAGPASVSEREEDRDNTPPHIATGFLASSPSHYLLSYKISEDDFRRNYDGIRSVSYSHSFSLVNNFVQIVLPVKHVAGMIWKAALRCSFEPPDGDEVQRPLVIYLKKLGTEKFVRVHLMPGGMEQTEANDIDGVPGVPGSLERLSDVELKLQGYVFREISILARYEQSFLDADPKDKSITRLPQILSGIKTPNLDDNGREHPPKPNIEMGESPRRADLEPGGEAQVARITAREYFKSGIGELLNEGSSFPRDLTGCVTRSDRYPFACGAHGDIYRGNLNIRGTSTQVAIKTSRIALLGDEHLDKNSKRFRREITVWLKLNHPNVLPLLGIIRDPSLHPEIPAMVCLWIQDGALSTYLQRHDELSLSRKLDLVNDVAHGLQYLHSQRVIHGDLSGSNVLVNADGSACISDFGLSTLLANVTGSTFATSAKGTMRWMAPELLDLDDSQLTPTVQSDVYSFGSIMLQIFTGAIPYHYYTRDAQVIHAVARGMRPKRPNQIEVTDKRWGLIEWCWSPAELRPSSDQIVMFMEKELTEVMMMESEWRS